MRLMTYQNLPDDFWKGTERGEDPVRTISEYKRKRHGLDFEPVWCVTAENVRDSIISNLTCAPNEPYLVMFLDTDRYFRVDKVEWYRRVRDDVDEIPLTDDADDVTCEFVVPAEELVGSVTDMFFLPPAISSIQESLDMTASNGALSAAWREFMSHGGVSGYVHDSIEQVSAVLMGFNYLTDSSQDNRMRQRMKSESVRRAFVMSMLPLILQLVSGKPGQKVNVTTCWSDGLCHCARRALNLCNKMTVWANGPCDREGYGEIVRLIDLMLVGDDELLDRLLEGPSRNDPCPCGSGLKFKRCHGLVW